jgi:type IV secretory pathway VirB10-like protein
MTGVEPAPHPKASVESVLFAPRRPVTRYRPVVIAAGLGGVVSLVGLGFLIAFGGGHHGAKPPAASPPVADAPPPAAEISRRLPATYADLGAPGPGAGLPPPDPGGVANPSAAPGPGAPSPEIQRRQAEVRAARASSPFFAQAGAARAASSTLAVPAVPADLAAGPATPAAAGLSPKQRFVAEAASGQDFVAGLPHEPLSIYEVKAGTVIPAALVTGLNSDLPGPVIAQVTEPVFDHQTGRIILIPQGSRLLGKYDSQVSYGQNRALVVWTRLIFPSGRSVNLGAMIGADPTGAGGLTDRVDTHLPLLARAAGLSTLISVGAAAAQNSLARGSDNLVLQDGAGGLTAQASQVGQQLVDRDLQHAPTIRIRPGWPLRVLVDRDLVLAP